MAKKYKKFADDGWAVWIDGDDTSTIYINDWLNPKGKSYVDMAIRIRNIKASKFLNVYVPFSISADEIEDVSLLFNDTKILQATFSAACIVDFKKNTHTSEIAYNGKVCRGQKDFVKRSKDAWRRNIKSMQTTDGPSGSMVMIPVPSTLTIG